MSGIHSVLIVDDEADIAELLEYQLTQAGYRTKKAFNGPQAIAIAKEWRPNMILLDVGLPMVDGIEVCRQLREDAQLKHTFVVFLTARGEEYTEVAAFQVGADDFIQKPVKPRALLKRLEAVLRREKTTQQTGNTLAFGSILLDRSRYLLELEGKEVHLPRKEFELLWMFMLHPGRIFSREVLLKTVWEVGVEVVDRTVDVHIRRLREKIGDKYIQTVKGMGYKFVSSIDELT